MRADYTIPLTDDDQFASFKKHMVYHLSGAWREASFYLVALQQALIDEDHASSAKEIDDHWDEIIEACVRAALRTMRGE